MEEIIAKKYAYALIGIYNKDEAKIQEITRLLSEVSQAFCIERFQDIIHSPYIPKAKKREFLLSLFNDQQDLKGFIELLIQNNRVEILPFVAHILEKYVRSVENNYKAILYAPRNLDSSTIANIAQNLSKKLGIHLSIEQSSSKIDGIRLSVEDLGVEISFLKKRFFEDLRSHILRVI